MDSLTINKKFNLENSAGIKETGSLVILRERGGADGLREYDIYIDDKFKGRVLKGEGFFCDLPMGVHKVYLKIDWCTTKVFSVDIKSDDIVYLITGTLVSTKNPLSVLRVFTPKNYIYLKELEILNLIESKKYRKLLNKYNDKLIVEKKSAMSSLVKFDEEDSAGIINALLKDPDNLSNKKRAIKNLKTRVIGTGIIVFVISIIFNLNFSDLSKSVFHFGEAIIRAVVISGLSYFVWKRIYSKTSDKYDK